MNKFLSKKVREQFLAKLSAALPEFQEVDTRQIPQGSRLLAWEFSVDLSFYLMLFINPKEDAFTVDVAWSRNARWPALFGLGWPEDPPRNGELRFRLGHLWACPRKDVWWELPTNTSAEQLASLLLDGRLRDVEEYLAEPRGRAIDNALPQVEPMVGDAISKIVQYGIPYFGKIAAQYGYRDKWDAGTGGRPARL